MKKVILSIIMLVFILSAPAFAVTRFHLPSSGAAEISPAFDAGWGVTTGADRIRCVTNKVNTALTDKSGNSSNLVINVLNRQYVSDPIAAQTLSGTVKGQLKGIEGHINHDSVSAILVKVVSSEGTIVRGTLIGITYPALIATNEYSNATSTNRYTPITTTATVVTAESGDRIVVEVGYHRYGTTPAGFTTQNFGDASAADLLEDQADTAANNPWVEFSQDIRFPSVTVDD